MTCKLYSNSLALMYIPGLKNNLKTACFKICISFLIKILRTYSYFVSFITLCKKVKCASTKVETKLLSTRKKFCYYK